MYKIQIFQEALGAVMDETGLDKEQILSRSKNEEVVEARIILVRILNELGLHPVQISRLSGICVRSVNRFLNGFRERYDSRKILRIIYENVKTKVGLA